MKINILDCTFRDGGYYNNWDFDLGLINSYFEAMETLKIDFIEVGFRSLKNQGFKGGFAYSTDKFLTSLNIPDELKNKVGVMVNASELVTEQPGLVKSLEKLFVPKSESPVSLVRIACHAHELANVLPAATWLKEQGYLVGFNLMQIAVCTDDEIISLAKLASDFPLDVLYFADSMGGLNSSEVKHIVSLFRQGWSGAIGIHTHDNMNQALANSIAAVEEGTTWVDSTVTGMGRGPGNVPTEYLSLALEAYRPQQANITKLLELISHYLQPMKVQYGWGTNPYYYLAGQFGIHPSYVQEMLSDNRYTEEDILAVIEYLKVEGGKKFSHHTLDSARHFYSGAPRGQWNPKQFFKGQEVLLLGTGPGVAKHRKAIESYIIQFQPIVMTLNTQSSIEQHLIDIRIACHPLRLLADCKTHVQLSQPLITPASMLPRDVLDSLKGKELLDFGLQVQHGCFEVSDKYCVIPNSLVLSYALATLATGQAKRILLAGFDGYGLDDPRHKEVDHVFNLFLANIKHCPILSVTPTLYEIPIVSIYALESGL